MAMCIARLQTLVARFWAESDQLRRRFLHVFPKGKGHEACADLHLWTQEMCVIRLQDAWARFCRELVLMSASEQPLTASGVRLPRSPGIARRIDALNALRTRYSRPPHEPKWYDAQSCLTAAAMLRVANYASISAGLSVTPSPLDDLRDLRNFLAHRTESTALRVCAVAMRNSLSAQLGVLAILASPSTAVGTCILEHWIRELQTMAQIAVR